MSVEERTILGRQIVRPIVLKGVILIVTRKCLVRALIAIAVNGTCAVIMIGFCPFPLNLVQGSCNLGGVSLHSLIWAKTRWKNAQEKMVDWDPVSTRADPPTDTCHCQF